MFGFDIFILYIYRKYNINMKFTDLHSEERENLNKTGVYLIQIITKPNYYYIGSAAKTNKKNYNDIGFLQRWRNHFSTLKRNIHFNPILQRSVNKYGIENLRFKILEYCEPEKCIEIEDKWLQYYINNFNVYNINKIHPTRLGQINSKEHRKNISNGRNKKKVYQFDFEGNLIKEWDCMYHILKYFPKANSSIWRCLNNKQQTSNKFIWSYDNKFKYKSFNKSKIVYQFDLKGNFIKKWKSGKDVERILEISYGGVNKCCRNKRLTAGGFKWSFVKNNIGRIDKLPSKKRLSVVQLTKQNIFIREFSSITEAAKNVNSTTTNICNCCNNKPHCITAGGFKWKYKKDYEK